MIRLDQFLMEKGYFETRNQAQIEIKNNAISVNGKIINKPSFKINETDDITINKTYNPYVSKGGLKLEKALKEFNIDVKNKYIIDIGSSTGGFTDCLLKNGATNITCIDVGNNQLHDSLRGHHDISLYEQTNFLNTDKELLNKPFDLAVMDVSFISSRKIIKHLFSMFPNITLILLFKPQYEVGKELNKNGVVKAMKVHKKALEEFYLYMKEIDLNVNKVTYSPLKGGTGNIEFLLKISNVKEYQNYQQSLEDAHLYL
ncbi:hypothetical protein CI105_08695 [Candidatus Izimaplasma bacterium ZiA1]|uniref:TlyA family RNA methyltransferase n=1 Tax=Candidatus Izimoplasma sp. ZiA1 TaxID=2024899 RepID=UPI000BAA7FFB|nr:hypothetical protein CI105_08695 [Candidatus Izimaplasma bacterium ZiA1]